MGIFRIPADTPMTAELLGEYIGKHKTEVAQRYQKLKDAYENRYDIYRMPKKADWKPDNRISVNFARYIVDTLTGFFIGIPVKTASEDSAVADYLELLDQYNDVDNVNSELSKICSIYGSGYEMYYTDADSQVCIAYLDPTEAFMIYDESILERPLYFVRYYRDWENVERGSWSDGTVVQHFVNRGAYQWDGEPEPHYFDGVPATEFVENDERTGVLEGVLPMINAYNKAISEKANDVDYFADAYLKVLGAALDDSAKKDLRANRLINLVGEDADRVVVEFLQKPDGDATQEHLIDRLERLIFQVSMVANISEEDFGTASGVALRYRLQGMSNMARVKERKFASGMNRRYRLIFSNPVTRLPENSWVSVTSHFTMNYPANIADEANTARNLEGVVSKETQLKVLSVVDSVPAELERMEKEEATRAESAVDRRMFSTEGAE